MDGVRMKRIIILLLCSVLTISVTGCSSVASTTSSAKNITTSGAVSQEQSASSGASSQPEVSVASTNDKTKFEQFKSGIDGLGLKYTEVVMGAQLIGAEQGTKYKLSSENSIELYRFDTSSDSYKKAKKNKAVTLEGFGDLPVEIQDDMGIMFNGTIKDKDKILDIFKALK